MISGSRGVLELIDKKLDSLIYGTVHTYLGTPYDDICKEYPNRKSFYVDNDNKCAEFPYKTIYFLANIDLSRFLVAVDSGAWSSGQPHDFSFFKIRTVYGYGSASDVLNSFWFRCIHASSVEVSFVNDLFWIRVPVGGGGDKEGGKEIKVKSNFLYFEKN